LQVVALTPFANIFKQQRNQSLG